MLNGMPAPTAALLVLDFESTGLLDDEHPPTLLEVAWTIADQVGTQLTPLRTRLLGFDIRGSVKGLCTPELAEREGGEPYGYFDTGDGPNTYPRQVVVDLHEKSGLLTDWALTDQHDRYAVLRDPVELDRQIVDDLRAAGIAKLEPRSLRLTGCGVARYEAEILPYVAPRTMNPQAWPWHYRPADLSVELSNGKLRGSKLASDVDAIIEHGLSIARTGGEEWRLISTEHRSADIETFATPHRADTDVARALAAWRLLALDGR